MTTSYTGPGGSGDRTAIPVVSISGTLNNNSAAFVDGIFANKQVWWQNGDPTGKYVTFKFEFPVVIDEIKYYQSDTTPQGVFQVQGSNDGENWTNIGVTFSLGGVTIQTITTLSGNSTAYLYYRLLGISGYMNGNTCDTYEFEFKTAWGTPAPLTAYSNPGGYGNRTSLITISTSLEWVGPIENLVDGVNVQTTNWPATQTVAGKYIQIDFLTPKIIQEVIFLQSYGAAQGTWKWQGLVGASWVDISSSFAFGGAARAVDTSLSGNITAYTSYRMLGVSGSTDYYPYSDEMFFKLGDPVAGGFIIHPGMDGGLNRPSLNGGMNG